MCSEAFDTRESAHLPLAPRARPTESARTSRVRMALPATDTCAASTPGVPFTCSTRRLHPDDVSARSHLVDDPEPVLAHSAMRVPALHRLHQRTAGHAQVLERALGRAASHGNH